MLNNTLLPGLQRTPVRPQATAQAGELAEQVAAIIFTSGTTGQPKGVMLTHAGLLQFAKESSASRALGPHDRSYACLPMTHIFGLGTVLMASLHARAGLVMRSRFDPADVFEALAHHGVLFLDELPECPRAALEALREGMLPLRLAGCAKLAAGVTSVEEVLGHAARSRGRS